MSMNRYNICIHYIIPIIIHLIFLPFWVLDKNGIVALVEIFIGTVIIPVYLIIISTKSFSDLGINKFFILLATMLFVETTGIIIEYFNWGIVTGNLLKPDSETVLIVKIQMIISSIIIIVGWFIIGLIKNNSSVRIWIQNTFKKN